jgi:hypothetical protein
LNGFLIERQGAKNFEYGMVGVVSIFDGMEFQLSNNGAASSAISFSVEAASIGADILSRSIVFDSDLIAIMELFSIFLVNTLNVPDNSVVNFVLLDSMD